MKTHSLLKCVSYVHSVNYRVNIQILWKLYTFRNATDSHFENNVEAIVYTDKKHNRYAIRQQCADGRRAGQDARVIAGRV